MTAVPIDNTKPATGAIDVPHAKVAVPADDRERRTSQGRGSATHLREEPLLLICGGEGLRIAGEWSLDPALNLGSTPLWPAYFRLAVELGEPVGGKT